MQLCWRGDEELPMWSHLPQELLCLDLAGRSMSPFIGGLEWLGLIQELRSETVEYIADGCFGAVVDKTEPFLRVVDMPACRYVGTNSFVGISSLVSVNLPSLIEAHHCFRNCVSIKQVVLPDSFELDEGDTSFLPYLHERYDFTIPARDGKLFPHDFAPLCKYYQSYKEGGFDSTCYVGDVVCPGVKKLSDGWFDVVREVILNTEFAAQHHVNGVNVLSFTFPDLIEIGEATFDRFSGTYLRLPAVKFLHDYFGGRYGGGFFCATDIAGISFDSLERLDAVIRSWSLTFLYMPKLREYRKGSLVNVDCLKVIYAPLLEGDNLEALMSDVCAAGRHTKICKDKAWLREHGFPEP